MDSTLSRTTQPLIPITSLLHDPSSQVDPVAHAEKQVEAALDDLVATGALQTNNRMDIESLLNPAGESHVLTETSDKEIYQAVIDSIGVAALARENIGGDEEDIPIKPRPTRHDIRKAVSTDTSMASRAQIEVLLGSFNRQLRLEETRSMKGTV
jgi:hypothetical protein